MKKGTSKNLPSMKTLILLGLVVVFNEFIGTALVVLATLLIKMGGAIARIPEVL